MTLQEFLNWQEEDVHAEWASGEVLIMSPVSRRHQELVGFLGAVMRVYAEARGLGRSLSAPYSMHLAAIPSVREPDLLFVATAHLDRLGATYLAGPADLVVEIVSPDSIGRDRGEKYAEYEAAGVGEYWLIDPVREQAEFYLLGDARYRLADLRDGRFHSRVLPGLALPVAWLWQDPLPNTLEALRELELL